MWCKGDKSGISVESRRQLSRKVSTRERLLHEAIRLFSLNGYHGTSLAMLSSMCGISKPSIYEHFESKKEIGLNTLKLLLNYCQKNLFSITNNKKYTHQERCDKFLRNLRYFLSEERCMSLLPFSVILDFIDKDNEFYEVIQLYFSQWCIAIENLVSPQLSHTEKKIFAQHIMFELQGGIILGHILQDQTLFTLSISVLESAIIEQYPVP